MPLGDRNFSPEKFVPPDLSELIFGKSNQPPKRFKAFFSNMKNWGVFIRRAEDIENDDVVFCLYCGKRARMFHPNGDGPTQAIVESHVEHRRSTGECPAEDSCRNRTENSYWGAVLIPVDDKGNPIDGKGGESFWAIYNQVISNQPSI